MIATTLNAIVESLREINSAQKLGLKSINEHAGSFTWQEFKERSYNAPAAFVTNLGWRELNDNEDAKVFEIDDLFAARFAIAIITSSVRGFEQRNRQGRLICEYVSRFLSRNNFGLGDVSEAYNIKVDPRFMGVVSDDGQALWVIDWWHHLPICPEGTQPLDEFDGVDMDHANPDNSEQILAETTIDLHN